MSKASSGLRRREGNLDPLLGFCRVENRSARTLRLHCVVELKHNETYVFPGASQRCAPTVRSKNLLPTMQILPLRTNNVVIVGVTRK